MIDSVPRLRAVSGKLGRVGARELVDMLHAQLLLVVAWCSVRARPRGRLVESWREIPSAPTRPEAIEQVQRLARAMHLASTYGIFRPRCLVRAVALQNLLRRRGIEGAVIRIGVRRDGRDFAAHAWVEFGNAVVGDDPRHTSQFVPLGELSAIAAST